MCAQVLDVTVDFSEFIIDFDTPAHGAISSNGYNSFLKWLNLEKYSLPTFMLNVVLIFATALRKLGFSLCIAVKNFQEIQASDLLLVRLLGIYYRNDLIIQNKENIIY